MVRNHMILRSGTVRHRDHTDFVLRRKTGRIWKRACKAPDQLLLVRWYDKYNRGEPLKRMRKTDAIKAELLEMKRRLWKIGIKHQISFYGVLRLPLSDFASFWSREITSDERIIGMFSNSRSEYRRYELFSRDAFTHETFKYYMDCIKAKPPAEPYGVFLAVGVKLFQLQPKTVQSALSSYVIL